MTATKLVIRKADPVGHIAFEYPGELVYQDEQLLVARCIWEAPKPFRVGSFQLERGDIFMEHFYRDEWFNVFRVYSRIGELKGWYCNITLPVEQDEERLTWRDLALDLLVLPDGRQYVLDEDEFAHLALDSATRARALQALDDLRARARQGIAPFDDLLPRQAP